MPEFLVSDNASNFSAYEFSLFLNRNAIQHITPPPYSPASNGQAERAVRVIKDMLKKAPSNCSFKYKLSKVLLQYRTVPHSVTQNVPSVALNKRKLITMREKINPHFSHDNPVQSSSVKSIPQFYIGNSVLALNLRGGQKWYDAKIGINIYDVHVHDLNITWRRHANQLLPSIPECSLPMSEPASTTSGDCPPRRSGRRRQPPDRLEY